MKKNTVRLTEAQLHRVIKESVKRVLKEVQFGGESLHGNNSEDWQTVANLRGIRASNYGQSLDREEKNGYKMPRKTYNSMINNRNNEYSQQSKNLDNARDISDENFINANKRANNIAKNVGY